MGLDGDARLADEGGEQGGDEEAHAPEPMRAVHHGPPGLGLDPSEFDVEVDLQRTGEEAGDEEHREDQKRIRHPGNQRIAGGGAEDGDEGREPQPQPLDQRRGEGERDEGADRHADQGQPQLGLGDAERRLQIRHAGQKAPRLTANRKKQR